MRFEEFVRERMVETGQTRTAFLRDFSRDSGVSLQTLQSVARGAKMVLYTKAKLVSEATGGKVTISDLCADKTWGGRLPPEYDEAE